MILDLPMVAFVIKKIINRNLKANGFYSQMMVSEDFLGIIYSLTTERCLDELNCLSLMFHNKLFITKFFKLLLDELFM